MNNDALRQLFGGLMPHPLLGIQQHAHQAQCFQQYRPSQQQLAGSLWNTSPHQAVQAGTFQTALSTLSRHRVTPRIPADTFEHWIRYSPTDETYQEFLGRMNWEEQIQPVQ